MKARPSSLPMLAQCARWVGNEDRGEQDKNAGTVRHQALRELLEKGEAHLDGDLLPDEEMQAVVWAAEYIRTHAPTDDHPMHIERRLTLLDEQFAEITSGTPDVTCGPELFDLKWRERDYHAQMAAYAAAMMQENGWPQVRIHLLFAERQHAQVFTITEAEAVQIVTQIIARAANPDTQPTACDYCGWCANRLNCPALTVAVKPVVDAREEFTATQRQEFSDWLALGAKSSELTNAQTAGMVLKIARQIAGWCEAVEHHCKELAFKQGIVPQGFRIQSRQGNRFIPSVTDAFARAGLPQEEFLKGCEIKFSSLVELMASLQGMKKAQAERTVAERLGDAVQRKASSMSLVAEKVGAE